jgi:imidazolonepropionase-like amidohydrolase
VPNKAELEKDPKVRVFHGRGRTLMSGLGDAHTHFTWNGGDLDRLGDLGVEEHVLLTARSAQCYLDSGYTMYVLYTLISTPCGYQASWITSSRCFGAASAKERLDIVIRDAINAGDIPGPRYLANGKEMARRDGDLVAGITAYADGPDEMREVIRHHVKLGVDNIKLSMSGEEVRPLAHNIYLTWMADRGNAKPTLIMQITEIRSAQDCYFTDEETAACVDEAHKLGKRLCAHARARDSVKMCVRHGVDVIYHASYIDDEGKSSSNPIPIPIQPNGNKHWRFDPGMDMLEKVKTKHIVAPGINWLIATLEDAEAFGYPKAKAEQVGYKKELNAAIKGLREMHKRGIIVLPGGDYGFAWTPHGTYARDLSHFTTLLGFTTHEAIIAATAGVAALFMRGHELGKIQPGYYGDCVLVDGDPLEDIRVLQDHDKLNVILINGRVHKAGRREYVAPPVFGHDGEGVGGNAVVGEEFPEVKRAMQKNWWNWSYLFVGV